MEIWNCLTERDRTIPGPMVLVFIIVICIFTDRSFSDAYISLCSYIFCKLGIVCPGQEQCIY